MILIHLVLDLGAAPQFIHCLKESFFWLAASQLQNYWPACRWGFCALVDHIKDILFFWHHTCTRVEKTACYQVFRAVWGLSFRPTGIIVAFPDLKMTFHYCNRSTLRTLLWYHVAKNLKNPDLATQLRTSLWIDCGSSLLNNRNDCLIVALPARRPWLFGLRRGNSF